MEVTSTEIPEVKIIRPTRHDDVRGFFSEVFREDVLQEHGIAARFVQVNHSLSVASGVIRGLHFQIPPFAQAKLVRVITGAIFDVAVDIRWGSPSFGRHVSAILSPAEWNQMFIPEGFAHGFCTIEPNTEVIYKVNRYYSPAHDRGLRWDDSELAICWPRLPLEPLLSERDRAHPRLADLARCFDYHPPAERAAADAP
jgi:dTDP-4-dehydrorhamnose 3,5-epimerase